MAFDARERPVELREGTGRREAVGLFDSAERLERAVNALQAAGFNRSELSILASDEAIRGRLGHGWQATGDLADLLTVPRTVHEESESLAEARSGIVAAAGYVPAMIGSVVVAASGGTILAIVAVALASCGIGGTVGLWLARMYGRDHAMALATHLEHGGLLLWVYARDETHETRALDVLRRAGATDVHLHDLPPPAEPTDEERFAPVIRPQDRIVY